MIKAVEFLRDQFLSHGITTAKIIKTKGHPVLFAERKATVENSPTVLIYGHYDVQPVDPIDLWKTDPFESTEIVERLYGRGASDMKGQIIASLAAFDSIFRSGDIPINFKFIIEGEEEIGSPNLSQFLEDHKVDLENFDKEKESEIVFKEEKTSPF